MGVRIGSMLQSLVVLWWEICAASVSINIVFLSAVGMTRSWARTLGQSQLYSTTSTINEAYGMFKRSLGGQYEHYRVRSVI